MDSNDNNDEPDEEKVAKVITQVKEELKKMGIDITKIKFGYGDFGTVRARVHNGIVEFCSRSLEYGLKEQTSIAWHEIYHINNDWNKKRTALSEPIVLNPPPHIEEYLRNTIAKENEGLGYTQAQLYQFYKEDLTIWHKCPNK